MPTKSVGALAGFAASARSHSRRAGAEDIGDVAARVVVLFSSSMFAVPTPPKSQPARVNGTHGAGVVLPVSVTMFGGESSAPSTGLVQYLNDEVNAGTPSGL